jgi:hypothetical protein
MVFPVTQQLASVPNYASPSSSHLVQASNSPQPIAKKKGKEKNQKRPKTEKKVPPIILSAPKGSIASSNSPKGGTLRGPQVLQILEPERMYNSLEIGHCVYNK